MNDYDTSRFTPLDIETGSAEDLYRRPPDPSYVRLTGVSRYAFQEPACMVVQRQCPYVTVNGHYFDFPALDRHCGIPVEQTIPFSRDLRVAAFQHDPPTSAQTKHGPSFKSYSMAALTQRYLGADSKSDQGESLAKEYGSWDAIPVDDPRYAEYLRSDLENTRRLNEAIPWDPYEEREAWVSTITARASLTGFRVDVGGLTRRVDELAAQSRTARQMLASRYGFPLTNDAGKEAKAPQRTKAGKGAFENALADTGFPVGTWPRGKDGTVSLSKETMAKARDHAESKGLTGALTVIDAVSELNGVRNNAANLLRCTTADGRVHPQFLPFQATGRWSVLEPGLTVLKKGSEDSERAFLLADEGDVLVSIDLDQIDIRAVAAHAQDPALIALLNDPERDIHTEIAELSGVPRKQAKTLDLGWLYGRSANAMAQMPGMTREAAFRVSDYMATAFPGVVRYQQETRARGEAGILLDNGAGRKLRVAQDRAYTQSVAMVGQSATRDLVARGLIELARRAPEMLPMLRVVVHDECVFSVPLEHAEECARIAQDCLSGPWAPAGASMAVNITAGQGKPFVFGGRWSSLYT